MKKSTKTKTKKPAKKSKAVKKVADRGDILEIILQHHKPLKKLIKTMKSSDASPAEVRRAFDEFAPLLVNHAKPEEKALYIPMKEQKSELRTEAFEGDTEHHIADQLVSEIKAATDKDKWRARVKVLAELVEHHIEEEEEDMFKDVRKEFSIEERVAMGEEYTRLYEELSSEREEPISVAA